MKNVLRHTVLVAASALLASGLSAASLAESAGAVESSASGAVTTGAKSRAELHDDSGAVIRLGSNAGATADKSGRSVSVSQGSVLVSAPEGTTIIVKTATGETEVSGATVIVTVGRDGAAKLHVLAGQAALKTSGGDTADLPAGRMAFVDAHGTLGATPDFDLDRLASSSRLVKGFAKELPALGAVRTAATGQNAVVESGKLRRTGLVVLGGERGDGLRVAPRESLASAINARAALDIRNLQPVVFTHPGQDGVITVVGANVAGGTLRISGASVLTANNQQGYFYNTAATGALLQSGGTLTRIADSTLINGVAAESVITGNGGTLAKSGAGTLTLSGANTYTGGTTINAGTLALGGATGGTLTLAVGTQVLTGGGTFTLANGTIDLSGLDLSAIGGSGGTFQLISGSSAGSGTFAGTLGGGEWSTNMITINGGTLTLTAVGGVSGSLVLNGGTLHLAEGASFAGSEITIQTNQNGLNLPVADSVPTLSVTTGAGDIALTNCSFTANDLVVVPNGTSLTLDGGSLTAKTGGVSVGATGNAETLTVKNTAVTTLTALRGVKFGNATTTTLNVDGATFAVPASTAIAMDAKTLNLQNINFPAESLVTLRSRDGVLNIGDSQVGAVNFISGVTYGGADLTTAAGINAHVNAPHGITQNGAAFTGATGNAAGAVTIGKLAN